MPATTVDPTPSAVFWDVGNVLLRWDPLCLYRTLFDDPDELEHFVSNVWTSSHNSRCDGGEPYATVMDEVIAQHPKYKTQVLAVLDRWIETIPGPVDGMLELLGEVKEAGVAQFGLTNFSAETFPQVTGHPHFDLLDGVVVSGSLGFLKPDPRIFEAALDLAGVAPELALFVDDSATNVEGARAVGIRSLLFVDAARTRAELVDLGLLG
ncbi:MAG: HAD family phosphatase [Microthrixaceae bacterium]